MPVPPASSSDCRVPGDPGTGPAPAAREQPSTAELRDLLAVARQAAIRSGAGGADADDVAQLLVQRLWSAWDAPHIVAARRRGPNAWNSYVRAAARNAVHDQRRSERRRRGREKWAATPARRPPSPARPGSQPPSLPPGTEAVNEYLVRLELLEVIRSGLTDRERVVAWRLLFEGWSVDRVAEDLGLSTRTVRHVRSVAIAKIRAALTA